MLLDSIHVSLSNYSCCLSHLFKWPALVVPDALASAMYSSTSIVALQAVPSNAANLWLEQNLATRDLSSQVDWISAFTLNAAQKHIDLFPQCCVAIRLKTIIREVDVQHISTRSPGLDSKRGNSIDLYVTEVSVKSKRKKRRRKHPPASFACITESCFVRF